MKNPTFILLIAFLFIHLKTSAQTWPVEKILFDSLYKAGKYQEAIVPGKQVFSMVENTKISDTTEAIKFLKRISYTFHLMDEVGPAERAIRLGVSLTVPGSKEHADLLVRFGGLESDLGHFQMADSLLQVAIYVFSQLGKSGHEGKAYAQYALGRGQMIQANYPEAENLLMQAAQYYQSVPVTNNVLGGCYSLLAQNYLFHGQLTKAVEFNKKAQKAWMVLSPLPKVHLRQNKFVQAQILLSQEDYAAVDSLLASLEIEMSHQGQPSPSDLITFKSIQGNYFFNLRQFQLALRSYQETLEIEKKVYKSYNNQMFSTVLNVAMNMYDSGIKSEAFILMQGMLDSLHQSADVSPRFLGYFMCAMAKMTDDKKLSLQLMQQGIDQFQKGGSKIAENMASDYVINLAERFLVLENLDEAEHTMQLLGDEAEPGLTFKAKQYRLKGLFLAKRNNWPDAVKNWGLYVQTRQTEFAQRLFFLTDSQRLKAGDQLQEANDLLLSHAMDLKAREAGITSVALNCLLFSKSLNLSTAQKIRQNIQKDTALAPLFSAWTDVREQLAWSYSQPRSVLESQKIDIPALEAHSDQLEKRLASESKDFAFESLHKTFTWTDIRDRLRPGEAAMEIAYFHEFHLLEQSDTTRYAVFLVRPEMREEPAVFFLPDGSYIDQIQIEKYLSECITPDGKGKTGDLYDAFWGKLTPYLQGVSRLYISADGSFLKINFSAIQLPSGKYVADQYEVRNVFSLKDILTNDQDPGETRKTGKTAFLAGNPAFSLNPEGNTAMAGMRSVSETYDTLTSLNPFVAVLREVNETRGVTLTPLPGSEQEVNDLAIILRKHRWETTVVTGISAKEETIKALNKPSVLHLATHGYFLVNLRSGTAGLSRPILESNPMFRSMVFLAGAQNALDRKPVGGEDGILTAYEAQNLQLDGTELVVLSACKTGQGKIQNGEGVYGLQRALHIAGAKAVLLSLWDVDDKVGREFMVLFYEKWLGGMMKTEAFRATQMEIRKKHPLPFYWAGFILMD